MQDYNYNIDTRSLYIHWPFCPYKCRFCPFIALVGQEEFMHDYHNSLTKEILSFTKNYTGNKNLRSIFLGGGTPSTYPEELLLDTFGIIRRELIINRETEITLEVNPGTVNASRLDCWKKIGINRVSIGVQTLKSKVLKDFNRLHSVEDVYLAVDQIYNKVTKNISIDLILGLPSVTSEDWKDCLKEIVKWPIKHVSIYLLTVHEGTPLFFDVRRKKIKLPNEGKITDLYNWTVKFLEENKIYRYELSNFSKDNAYYSIHNKVYWDHEPYKGFGLGAASFDGESRFRNEIILKKYLEKNNKITFSEKLTKENIKLEKLMLGLRQARGISFTEFENLSANKKSINKDNIFNKLDLFIKNKWLLVRDNNIKLTSKGMMLENELILKLAEL